MGKIVAVDYSVSHPSLAQLKAAGVIAVGRYYGQGSPPKNLTKSEAQLLTNNDISIFNLFEFAAAQSLKGAAQARADVSLFRSQRSAIGAPSHPCYFASDFDVQDFAPSLPDTPEHALAKLGPVGDYYKQVRTEMGGNSGGYGGYYLIKRLFDADLITWGFQTIAWSGGQRDKRAQLYQNAQTTLGNEADVDIPERAYFGQWLLDAPKPTPVPAPHPAAGPTREEAAKAAALLVDYLK